MVIYSWDWEGVKKSPDFPVIDELGQEIAALIPKEVEEGYYFCTLENLEREMHMIGFILKLDVFNI